jgi:hypothetical protein
MRIDKGCGDAKHGVARQVFSEVPSKVAGNPGIGIRWNADRTFGLVQQTLEDAAPEELEAS